MRKKMPETCEKSCPTFSRTLWCARSSVGAFRATIPSGPAIDTEVGKLMTHTHAKGLAVAVIDSGKVTYVQAYGLRDATGDPRTAYIDASLAGKGGWCASAARKRTAPQRSCDDRGINGDGLHTFRPAFALKFRFRQMEILIHLFDCKRLMESAGPN
jgi:hypothetical protein